eukprot:1151639-Pelagomonas_calceolata.AAC.1
MHWGQCMGHIPPPPSGQTAQLELHGYPWRRSWTIEWAGVWPGLSAESLSKLLSLTRLYLLRVACHAYFAAAAEDARERASDAWRAACVHDAASPRHILFVCAMLRICKFVRSSGIYKPEVQWLMFLPGSCQC